MKAPSSMLALSAALLAIALWGVVVYTAWLIGSETAAAQAAASAGASAHAQQLKESQTLSLASATAAGRGQLTQALNTGVLSLADLLTSAGRGAGVALKVSSATPVPSPAPADLADIHPALLSFNVQADGAFQKLFQAAALLSKLPAASSLESIGLSSSAGGPWHLSASVRIFTIASVSP